jgi:hypothetical protein
VRAGEAVRPVRRQCAALRHRVQKSRDSIGSSLFVASWATACTSSGGPPAGPFPRGEERGLRPQVRLCASVVLVRGEGWAAWGFIGGRCGQQVAC